MTHRAHPYSARIGILRPWQSRWFASRSYASALEEDIKLRLFLEKRLKGMGVNAIEIERSPAHTVIMIHTARPGLIIGRGGEGIERLKKEVVRFLARIRRERVSVRMPRGKAAVLRKEVKERPEELKLTVDEVKFPETHAVIMVEQIAQSLEKRLPFRRVMKQTIAKIMASKRVQGVKVRLAGRLDGSEMARREWLKEGKIPLQTLRADIDFAQGRAHLPYGDIGITVWIYKGEIFAE